MQYFFPIIVADIHFAILFIKYKFKQIFECREQVAQLWSYSTVVRSGVKISPGWCEQFVLMILAVLEQVAKLLCVCITLPIFNSSTK